MSTQSQVGLKFELLKRNLDERQRRLWAAAEAQAIGYGGVSRVAAATGISRTTICTGMRELQTQEPPATGTESVWRTRRPGGGAKYITEKDPAIPSVLEELLADEVAGDPMGEQRWVRSSLRHLAARLEGV